MILPTRISTDLLKKIHEIRNRQRSTVSDNKKRTSLLLCTLSQISKNKKTGEQNMKKSYIELYKQSNQEMGNYANGSPKIMAAFMKMHHIGAQDGALLAKHKELIALGIGIHTQCEGCITRHIHDALEAGATHDEIVETIDVAVYMGGGPCVMYGSKAFAALQEFEKDNSGK